MAISHLYPNSSPILNLNFIGSARIDPILTTIRSGSATYVGEDGYIKYCTSNTPRIEYDLSTKDRLGYLFEDTSTNFVLNSNTYASGYNLTNVTRSTSSQLSPDGVNTSEQIIENTANDSHILWIGSVGAVGTSSCFSTFIKPIGSRVWVRLWLQQQVVSAGVQAWFNLQGEGTVGTNNAVGAGVIESIGIKKCNNGWYKVWVAARGFDGTNVLRPHIYLANGDNNSTYTGDGTSGIFNWGWQVEPRKYPTSLMVTTGSTVTRGTDSLNILSKDYLSIFGGTTINELTVQCEASFPSPSDNNEFIYCFAVNDNLTEEFSVYRNSVQTGIFYNISGGAVTYSGTWTTNVGPDRYLKTCFAVDNSVSCRFCGGGSLQGSDTAAVLDPGYNNIKFGARATNGLKAKILYLKKFIVWGDRLPNNTLVNMTK